MSEQSADNHERDWNSYWAGGRRAGTFGEGGPQDEALEKFWLEIFASSRESADAPYRLLDVGCGSGAVSGFARAAFADGDQSLELTCLDTSQDALTLVEETYPGARTLCSGADSIPAPDGCFHHVVSQFGIEYAGVAAAEEAARVLAPGGELTLVMHQADGAIHRECSRNASALQRTLDADILNAFLTLARCAGDLRVGLGSKDAFEAADKALAPKVKAVEAVLQEFGTDICAGSLLRVYQDVAHMYGKIYQYDTGEVERWAENVGEELQRFHGRMQSMIDAALSETAVDEWRAALENAGTAMAPVSRLTMGDAQESAAWILRGRRV